MTFDFCLSLVLVVVSYGTWYVHGTGERHNMTPTRSCSNTFSVPFRPAARFVIITIHRVVLAESSLSCCYRR